MRNACHGDCTADLAVADSAKRERQGLPFVGGRKSHRAYGHDGSPVAFIPLYTVKTN
jgi:hypothetical protein